MEARYWLRVSGLPWQEATLEQFVQAERGAGFRPKPGCGPIATGGFSSGSVEGRVTYGEITKDKYDCDPEFLKAVISKA
mgnify:CR=1 FL=1